MENTKIASWLLNNRINYEVTTLENGDTGIFIAAANRQKVITYLSRYNFLKEWEFRANYTSVLCILKGGC